MGASYDVFLPLIRPLERFADRAERGLVDFEQPATEFENVFAEMAHALESRGLDVAELAFRDVLISLADSPVDELLPVVSLPTDPRARLLAEYLVDLNANYPFIATQLVGGSRLHSKDLNESFLLFEHLSNQAEEATGEKRAHRLRGLVETATEVFCREYCQVLYDAECVRQGRRVRQEPFGRLVQFAAEWTQQTLPCVVYSDAARLRNAAAHRGWRFDVATGLVEAKDRGWRCEYALDDLHALAEEMEGDVLRLLEASHYANADFLRLLIESPLRRVLDPRLSDDQRNDASRDFGHHMAQALAPALARLGELGWVGRRE